ncbi:MAG: hypothetical protein GYA21_15930 [Myxococcales bacterium]|nr:hypothetical protein [Myxococcales bacterium]
MRFHKEKYFFIAVLLAFSTGCGLDLLLGPYDDTCYDCRTVCAGTQGDTLDQCLAACVECQGHSQCFENIEWAFDGMTKAKQEWTEVDCSFVRTSYH